MDPILDWLHAVFAQPQLWGLLAALPLISVGFVGTVFPALPGTALIFCGFLTYGLITGFDSLSGWFFLGQGLLVVGSYLMDFAATAWGVRKFGGSKAAAWGAVLGTLLVFVLGPVGILVGPLLGAVVGELLMGEQFRQALHSGFGSFLGFIVGTAAKLLLAGIMAAWFFWQII
ncbi:MAG: DUF456 domain-containing protein [Candidatus Electronema sp. V4]|uniref:DUF456 domain-containing protein n=1 Tax=Candidatus Electronema sp. V4 TaxID=3454756 RepID=UPI00405546CB